MKVQSGILLLSLGLGMMIGVKDARAQVVSDGSLSTTVTGAPNYTITGGASAGNNLYHSFSQFSVPTGGSAAFDNVATVENIFARVTGGTASHIDGALQTNGTANLFLLNPSGILFGPNASLNIGGSLTTTTADSLLFPNDIQFSATDTAIAPLLTVSAPIGLQLGTNAGPITVQVPATPGFPAPTSNFAVASNQTLAMVGGQINFNNGANISVPDGHVEVWALQNGTVNIPTTGNWQLASSSTSPTWGNVTLSQVSSIDASGANGGAINIRGRGLTVQEGSTIRSLTFAGQGQGITVQTTEFVDLLGVSLPGQIFPGIETSVGAFFGPPAFGRAGDVSVRVENGRLRLRNGAGLLSSSNGDNSRSGDVFVHASDIELVGVNGGLAVTPTAISTTLFAGTNNESGNITVEADRIRLQDGGLISTSLVSLNPTVSLTGTTGDISIRATESFEISGATPSGTLSGVGTGIELFTEGQAGDIAIDVGRLQLYNGGSIRSNLAGIGQAGNISIQATEVTVSDPQVDVTTLLPGGITVAVGSNAIGLGGNVNLTADRLRLFDGGQLSSASSGQGTAGSVNLTVNSIDVQGISPSLVNGESLPSSITASANSSFNAGSVNIESDSLQVRDGAQVTVSNTGSGNAGNLNANARTIFLDNGGSLSAEVNGGGQGNIYLQATDTLVLRHGSNITTNAQGTSTGGNINIDARFIAAVPSENSDIVANAVQGAGGNIQITTDGIFGLEFRPQVTPESDITASSEFGVSGTVTINDFSLDPSSGLVELPTGLADSSNQVAQGCAASNGNTFMVTGRGGMSENPVAMMNRDLTWTDTRNLSAFRNNPTTTGQTQGYAPTDDFISLIEVNTWYTNSSSQVELIANDTDRRSPQSYATCSIPTLMP
ncbi:two-partner secretion domain-containing protein [Leptothoe spongobia]|uniref:S-layer family protein n=1 Tax=Leptothoe spongobia TAU-MAC 1115 TaxID=1967444 RepID=A0A947GMV2_9CYAN|nr:S-layer family protein [Leptothoe spongobia]MBT9317892.1 S-layer family protein [Leptothoe spongobia TAU-MAC 1115]